ncbi:hypothetical protein KPA97_63300 [Burkholderia cenocepacia]|nr:hypothetical protein [Burkholderia cenocepacia]MDR5670657.1 hypothetical protein [Burkholderia cenocepacia]
MRLRRERAAQRFERGGRLAHVDVDLVDLLDARHRLAVGACHQCAFGHEGLVDAAGDRCLDGRELQVELATCERRAGLCDVGAHCLL